MAETKRIVIVGGGVSGLTSALVLASNPSYKITIVGEDFPGDESPLYASPAAGANYLPVSTEGSAEHQYEKDTYYYFQDLATAHPESGVSIEDARLWNRVQDMQNDARDWAKELASNRPWFADVVSDFRVLDPEELPAKIDSGTAFKTFCINVPVYLQYLYKRVRDAGVIANKGSLPHISVAAHLHSDGLIADVVLNCTGVRAGSIGGVADSKVYPARGQICLVKNPCSFLTTTSGTDDGDSDVFYVQPRPNGTTVIGGSYQKGNWDTKVDMELAQRMLRRAVELCPELTDGKGPEALEVVRHVVGVRPAREGGIRVEKELINGVWVVHNYGHGGYGYQSSYGCAKAVEWLVKDILGGQEK
ncbi:D-amino-acid oxidase [Hypoxylon argillaceum]|nr:D-amino-acid oxidase [Hypoxylon argillaceum]